MSTESNKMRVLREFGPFLVILSIYNPKHFHGKTGRILIRNIGRSAGFTILVLTFFGIIASAYCVCSRNNFNLSLITAPLAIVFGGIQISCVYFSISSRSGRISAVVKRLEQFIQKRKPIPTNGFDLLEDSRNWGKSYNSKY